MGIAQLVVGELVKTVESVNMKNTSQDGEVACLLLME